MNETDKLIISISDKINKLIGRNDALNKEIDIFRKKAEHLENLVKDRNVEIENLTEQNNILKISKAVRTEEGAVDTKKRINELVREIDKCIGLLNQ
jgi:predicted  nucleic acid-binding Zn-ribbon protein